MAQTEAPTAERSGSGELFVCEECREPLSEDATTCPHCGHDPAASIERQAKWRLGVGAVLCFILIGAPIGVPLVISGFLHSRKADGATPAVSA